MAEKLELCGDKLADMFDRHDYNKDGTIEYKEIKPILKELGFTDAAIEDCSLDLVSKVH